MEYMTVKAFKTLRKQDWENGAVHQEIYNSLKDREQLQTENSALCRQAAHNGLFIEQLETELKQLKRWPDYFAWEREMKKVEAENKKYKKGLYKIRKSTEIMEARRFAEEALKEQK